ncbi:MAG: oligosaccharide flippase family protein [Hyphomicrobiales bacterium]|nr:oligosaccharide flippase family protein [Hyphomicrobiales bacterium]
MRQLLASPLARNTFYYGINFSFQVFVQFGFFALISRALGPSGYGTFASVSAVALMVSVFVGWGSEHILIQRVAVSRADFPDYFGRSLMLTGITMVPGMIFAFLVLHFLETGNFSSLGIFCLIVAECGFRKITFLGSAAYMAHDQASKQFLVDNGSLILRLLAVLALWLSADVVTLDMWALWYLAASALAAAVTLTMVLVDFGRPRFTFAGFDFKLGFLFSLEFASASGLRDMDKPVILQTLGTEQAGLYTAAFRIVDAATAPIRAVLYATYTRYFRHADESAEHGIAFGVRVIPFVLGIGILLAAFILFVAGYVPLLLGSEYDGSVGLIRILAIYPLLLGLAGIGADIMRSIGMQAMRVVLILISNFAIIGFVWAGCIYGGLEGAVASRMALQVVILFTTWAIIGRRRTRANPGNE